jgi:hypothetical protein
MIDRPYMGIDWRRDHSFRVPRPDVGAATGSPDACTDCHADQTQDWAAARIAEWYPEGRHRTGHYGLTLARGRSDPAGATPDLTALALDEGEAAIVRATALYLLESQSDPELLARTAPLLQSEDPLLREAAAGLLGQAPAETRETLLLPLLTDPVLSVRIAAARQMLTLPPDQIRPSVRAALGEAMLDWQRALGTRLDFPETHLVLVGMALSTRNFQAAQAAFGQVVALDPQRVEAWSMLVRLTEAIEGPAAARLVLDEALARVPDDPGLLGLGQQLRP